MKPTNEKVGIELQHMPTGEMNTWYFADHSVPAQSYINDRIKKLAEKHEQVIKKYDLPTDEDGAVDFSKVSDDKEEAIEELTKINKKTLKLQMDGLACILSLKGELPPEYENEREYLEEHIGSNEVIPMIKHFFSQHSGSTTALPEDGKPLVLFRKPNGETIDPVKELHQAREKARKKKESDSESKNSSTD